MEDNNNKDNHKTNQLLFNKGIKSAWDKLPTALKLKIILGAGIFLVALIIFMAIIGSVTVETIDYSKRATSISDKNEMNEYFKSEWYNLCDKDDEYCQDINNEYIEGQYEFYTEFNSTVKDYNLNEEQQYTLLTTIFFDYDIDEVFSKEKSNVRLLAQQFKRNEKNNESYYNYLKNNSYFDDRSNLDYYFIEYANANAKDAKNLNNNDRIQVRTTICDYIIDIVNDYIGKDNEEYIQIRTNNTGYWWPIGSSGTTEENGKLFATGTPTDTYISSYYGIREHPTEHVIKKHNGIDIPGDVNTANVIASMSGEVTKVYSSCVSYGERYCGGGFGNYIMILDKLGNTTVYAHLHQNSIRVEVGDIVSQGEVIAKVGSSGNSTGSHLHFEIRINGVSVNPLEYIDANEPRPIISDEFNFFNTVYSEAEFISLVNNYYSQEDVCKGISSEYTSRCNDLKDDILNNNGAEIIYRVATERNRNPELIFPRMMLEGYSPGKGHNYFGYACGNTYSGYSCTNGFSNFEVAITAFFDYASNYDNLFDMMSTYAYLGDYWYANIDNSSSSYGGCYYAKHIYPDGVPSRVIEACNQSTCTPTNNEGCVRTTQEDLDAYTVWQESKMTKTRNIIFK